MAESYVIGVDFGSDSVRVLIVNTETGENVGQGVPVIHVGKLDSISIRSTAFSASIH